MQMNLTLHEGRKPVRQTDKSSSWVKSRGKQLSGSGQRKLLKKVYSPQTVLAEHIKQQPQNLPKPKPVFA